MLALFFLLSFFVLALQSSLADEVPQPRHFSEAIKSPYKPQVLQYRSKIYGDLQQFGFCATDFDDSPKPLIVELMPGTYGSVKRGARDCAIICGIAGDAAASHHNRTMASDAVQFFRRWNGGVHRGGIKGDNEVRIPVLSDRRALYLLQGKDKYDDVEQVRVDAKLLKRANLLLIGDFTSNAVLAKMAGQLPLSVGADSLKLGGKEYCGSSQACLAVFPHPDHKRYVAVLTGQTPDAICGASHVGLQLAPDFIVFQHDRVVDWGFLNNDWVNSP